MINKIRALGAWYYTKGLVGGGQFRTAVNTARSLTELTDIVNVQFTD